MKIKKTIFVLAIWLPLSVANATISPIGPFTGDYSEGFESYPATSYSQLDVFPNGGFHGLVRQLGNSSNNWLQVSINHGSGLGPLYTVFPRSGNHFMGASGLSNGLEWVFDTPPIKIRRLFYHLESARCRR
ncbi:hypothetical protein ES703_82755 [subsurface metagenome]